MLETTQKTKNKLFSRGFFSDPKFCVIFSQLGRYT